MSSCELFTLHKGLLYPPVVYRMAGAATVQANSQQSLLDYMNKADVLGFMLVSDAKHPDFAKSREFCTHMLQVARDENPKAAFELYFEGAAQCVIDLGLDIDNLGDYDD
jgi:hypothetical protein